MTEDLCRAVEESREREKSAREAVSAQCERGHWRMSIPVQTVDSDIVISAALDDSALFREELVKAHEEIARLKRESSEFYMAYAIEESKCERLSAELARLKAENAEFKKYADVAACAYCGHEGPKDLHHMADHMMKCKKSPVSRLFDLVDEMKAELAALKAESAAAPVAYGSKHQQLDVWFWQSGADASGVNSQTHTARLLRIEKIEAPK